MWALAVEPIRVFTHEEPLRGVWRFRAVVDQRTVACMPIDRQHRKAGEIVMFAANCGNLSQQSLPVWARSG